MRFCPCQVRENQLMNNREKFLPSPLPRLLLALLLAGCGATAQTGTDGDRAARDIFESEDYVVVIAKSDDTTASLASRYLNDASKAWMIEDYNGVTAISPGQQVVIP